MSFIAKKEAKTSLKTQINKYRKKERKKEAATCMLQQICRGNEKNWIGPQDEIHQQYKTKIK